MRTTIGKALVYYSENVPRGEYVLVIEGAKKEHLEQYWSSMTLKEHVEYMMENEGMTKSDAIKSVAKQRDIPKSEVYNAMISHKE